MFPASLAVVTFAALLASVRWPGWSVTPMRLLAGISTRAAALVAAVIIGIILAPLGLDWLGAWLLQEVLPAIAGPGTWFTGPTLPRDLLAILPLGIVIAADTWRPDWLSPSGVRAIGSYLVWAGSRIAVCLLLLLPLLWGWLDVVAASTGGLGRWWYAAIATAGIPLPGPPPGQPDPRMAAFGWWLATSVFAVRAAWPLRTWGALLWMGFPLVGGLLAYFAHPMALQLAMPVFLGASLVAVALPLWHRDTSYKRQALMVAERAALFGIVALAFSLRWESLVAALGEQLSSDAGGYYEAALVFYQRVASEGTNPIALAYLDLHSAAREPLFPVLVRLVLDILGESPAHIRYVSMLGSLGAVVVTYLFGRTVLGVGAGLGAALLLATLPWHISRSDEGLREEVGLLLVFGLATLVVIRAHGRVGTAIAVGLLAAAAVLTRLDSAAVVAFLLVVWGVGLKHAWRHCLIAWGILGALVAPLLVGYSLRFREPLAPLNVEMGPDIQQLVSPLFRMEYAFSEVVNYFLVGTFRIYNAVVFSGVIEHLDNFIGEAALPVALSCFVAGSLGLLVRGPRLPMVLALLGSYLPPYAFIAGVIPDSGPYSDRYSYLVVPAAYAVFAWAATRPLTWVRSLPALRRLVPILSSRGLNLPPAEGP